VPEIRVSGLSNLSKDSVVSSQHLAVHMVLSQDGLRAYIQRESRTDHVVLQRCGDAMSVTRLRGAIDLVIGYLSDRAAQSWDSWS